MSVAYLRLLGATQKEAAESVGCGERSIRDWEDCSWWPRALIEAETRWLDGLRQKTRQSLEALISDREPSTVRFAAERILRGLEPPTQKTDVTTGGKPFPSQVRFEFVEPDGIDADD